MLGYNNRIARINLSDGRITYGEIGEGVAEKFIGGKGFGYYYFYRDVPPGTDAFSEGNEIIFATGLFNTLVPGASKVAVVSKSPETELINDSYAGDRFGGYLKKNGLDMLIIRGRSNGAVYLLIEDGRVEIMAADEIWGMGTHGATDALWKKHGDSSIAIIGRGGENLVRFANIIFDKERAAGRGGLGAVMGYKRLKAIVVKRGSGKIDVHDETLLKRMGEDYYERYHRDSSLDNMRNYGTMNGILLSSSWGMSPSYNFKKPYIGKELSDELSGYRAKDFESEAEDYIHGKSCPVKCARYVCLRYHGGFCVKPEYESFAMLGACTGVFDFPTVAYFNYLVNDLGIDSIATGNIIGWFFEMVEKGEIQRDETGFDISGFGDSAAEERIIKLMAERRGIGAVLAEGVKRAGEILKRGENYAVHVKGLESPAWDPRGMRAYALSYATADIGASHLRGWPSPRSLPEDGRARELVPSLIESRDRDALFDSLGLCKFIPYEIDDVKKFYGAITGNGGKELKILGWRVESIARIYNVLDHLNPPEEDIIPDRWWEGEVEGPAAGNMAFMSRDDFLEARREFYRLRGWNEEYGVPETDTLLLLGLENFVEDAKRALEIVRRRN